MSRARPAAEPIGVGIIGLGFMGRTHLRAYRNAAAAGFPNRLVAVADADPARRTGRAAGAGARAGRGNLERRGESPRQFDPAAVAVYARPEDLLADPHVGLVSICTPTDSHVALALAALAAGKHVLVEKPVALDARQVRRLAAAAAAARTLCMPAMCMRFWPAWTWLKERIDAGTFGAVRSATFHRLGSRPQWAGFYADSKRSGGAVFDLHIHDADFVRWCFGAPDRAVSAGTPDHVTTLYRYARGPEHVVAEGGWDHTPGFPFRMRYTVVFEEATAEFELGAAPELRLARAGKLAKVALEPLDGYDGEVRHLLDAIAHGRKRLAATLDEAAELTALLATEARQLGAR